MKLGSQNLFHPVCVECGGVSGLVGLVQVYVEWVEWVGVTEGSFVGNPIHQLK